MILAGDVDVLRVCCMEIIGCRIALRRSETDEVHDPNTMTSPPPEMPSREVDLD